jgi:lipopolysaccharide heptosyltransferase II
MNILLAEIDKILVVRLSSIGDIILTTPLLRSLKTRYPEAHITFMVKKQYQELLMHSPYIDELITFNSKEGFKGLWKIKQYLKQQHFDIFIDIHKNWRSRFLRLGLGAKKITSYSKLIFKRTLLIWFKIDLYRRMIPVYKRYFDSVRDLGIQYDGKGTEIFVEPENIQKIRDTLTRAGYGYDVPLVTICPSATYFNKRWLPERFIETANHLITEKSVFVVVHGGPEDRELCEMISSGIGERAINLAGTLSLVESAALLQLSKLVIANDSGLLHMAQSRKVPVVGIYGPTTRQLGYFPIQDNSTVIETCVSCRPCTHNGLDHCPKKHFLCMKNITTESVTLAALKYLT